jgi:hypothetical protein
VNSGSFTSVFVCGLLLEVTPQIVQLLLYRLARLVLVISLSGLNTPKKNSVICVVAGDSRCFGLFCGLLPPHPVVLPHVLHWLVLLVPYYRLCSAFCCLPGCQFGSFVSVFLLGGGESLGLHVHCKVLRVVLLAI